MYEKKLPGDILQSLNGPGLPPDKGKKGVQIELKELVKVVTLKEHEKFSNVIFLHFTV